MSFSPQVTQQSSPGTGHDQCLQTEFGEVCFARPGEQRPPQAVSEGTKGVAADTAADHLSTEFGEVRLVHQPESAGSQPTESGKPCLRSGSPVRSAMYCYFAVLPDSGISEGGLGALQSGTLRLRLHQHTGMLGLMPASSLVHTLCGRSRLRDHAPHHAELHA